MNVKPLAVAAVCVGLLSWVSPVMGQGSCDWMPLGTGTDGLVNAMAVFDDGTGPALFAGGSFTTAGGLPASNIAKWDGGAWSPVGPGTNGPVATMVAFDGGNGPALYVGGSFTTAGGNAASKLARWDGVAWSPVGMGFGPFDVTALVVWDRYYPGERYLCAAASLPIGVGGLVSIHNWGGVSWPVIGLMDGPVTSLCVHHSGSPILFPQLYAGGSFTQVASFGGGAATAAANVAKFPGGDSSWYALAPGSGGLGLYEPVLGLVEFDDGTGLDLYASAWSNFFPPPGHFYKWGGSMWASLFPLWSPITRDSLQVFSDASDAGLFMASGGVVTRWDGQASTPAGSIVGGSSACLEVFDPGSGPTLFLGGSFTHTPLGAQTIHNIARYSCPSTITLSASQLGGGGSLTSFANTNLTPLRDYFNIFSLDTSGGPPGSGPHLGLHLTTQASYLFILNQLATPLDGSLYHFRAQDDHEIWGGYAVPPLTLDGIVFDYTGGVIGAVSPVTRIVVQ